MRFVPLCLVAACTPSAVVAVAPSSLDGGGVTLDAAVPDLHASVDLAIPDLEAPPDFSAIPDLTALNDLSELSDLSALPDLPDLAPRDLAPPRDLTYVPPAGDDSPLAHAPPSRMSGAATLLAGQDVLDVSTDQGGGVWAVTATKVYYLRSGATRVYDQSSGLARGWWTWTDTYYGYGTAAPVTFASVAGGISGEAVIGNIGAIADRMQVNPSTGAVTRIDNMSVYVNPNESDPAIRAEQEAQLVREVAMLRAIADLNGTLSGTAYLGGFHGFSAFHGLVADCGCIQFQQHLHAFPPWNGIGGADVRGLALSAAGDVWQGDRDMVGLWPQRSLGPTTDFFQSIEAMIDVFPGVRDEVWGLGVDASDGVYVASYGNGLAYLAPATHQPSGYWSRDTSLPQNHLTDVTVDGAGEVWAATVTGGVARYNPGANAWKYYTAASGLASNQVHRVYFDKYASARSLYFATANGITVFRP